MYARYKIVSRVVHGLRSNGALVVLNLPTESTYHLESPVGLIPRSL